MPHIIFDLEATCWENDRSKQSEIIEIGAVKLADDMHLLGTFSKFVRPTIHPVLSDFCTHLTTITQDNVNSALPFTAVLKDFERWMGETVNLWSWGFYDKKQFLFECKLKGYQGEKLVPALKNYHRSLKHEFAELKGVSPCGMERALRMLHLSLDGQHHRGIDDSKNIAKIFKAIYPMLK